MPFSCFCEPGVSRTSGPLAVLISLSSYFLSSFYVRSKEYVIDLWERRMFHRMIKEVFLTVALFSTIETGF